MEDAEDGRVDPTKVVVGRCGEYNVFVRPAHPRHPHRMSLQ
ncbi:hypothetical protein [Streptomyces sp. NPDC001970]